jgi:putative transposase
MSLPRQVVAGRTFMVTRRCTQRTFLLRPDSDTNNAFLYCLAYAASKTEVSVVFFLAMSNHYHAGIVDKAGRLPEFLERFHKLLAKHQNTLRGRRENFWAGEQTSVVELADGNDVLAKMFYALSNPVKADLVERCGHWPGASSLDASLRDRGLHASRPWRFFRKEGGMPEKITLTLQRPVGFEQMEQDEFAKMVREGLAAIESAASDERRRCGRRVLGRALVLRQRWQDSPRSSEPRRQLKPTVAARNVWRKIEVLARNRVWLQAYRAARDLWLRGDTALFPPGTYWLRRFGGVTCDQPASN